MDFSHCVKEEPNRYQGAVPRIREMIAAELLRVGDTAGAAQERALARRESDERILNGLLRWSDSQDQARFEGLARAQHERLLALKRATARLDLNRAKEPAIGGPERTAPSTELPSFAGDSVTAAIGAQKAGSR